MWLSRRGMVWLLSLWPMLAGATEPPTTGSLPPPLTSVPPEGAWHSLARLEVTTLALLPRADLGTAEGFAQVEPTFIIDGGAEFGLNLGAPVRLRLWGGEVSGEQVRRKDWDSLSDWGQLVRGLKLGASSGPQPEESQRLHRRRELREEATAVGPASAAGAIRDAVPALTRETVFGAIEEVSGSTGRIAGALPKLAGLGARANGVFTRYVVYGDTQLQWIHSVLDGTTTLAEVASEVADPDMELALLRLTGPRLEAAMFGASLLAVWVDYLNLADAVLRQCPFYGTETLLMDLERVRNRIEPTMAALASLEPEQVEAAATQMPELMGQLTGEFQALQERARVANERGGKFMAAAQAIEMLTMLSTLKLSLPRLPPAAPALVGADLVMNSSGVMMGSQVVVTAEWVEMMRRLVQAGVISVPVVSAAVRIHAGQVLMAQAHQELPQGVRDALGDGPEVRAMHETGKAGAGMAERPRHHVLSDEYREWFEKRGFTGAMDIDHFCVELEEANHQAIHGGGDWKLGRTWPGEWNRMIMTSLRDAETLAGRMLTRNEILKIVAERMKVYKIPMNFTPWRGP